MTRGDGGAADGEKQRNRDTKLRNPTASDSIPMQIPTNLMVSTMVSKRCEMDFVHPRMAAVGRNRVTRINLRISRLSQIAR